MKIQSLLNPFVAYDDRPGFRASETPVAASTHPYSVAYTPGPRRQKIPKDAAIFSEGTKIVGHVNYPPYEGGEDDSLSRHHREYRVFPLGDIQKKGARHIPYNSDKKDFLDKTGRESFEVFQYTYRIPGEGDKEFVVLWDYNVGLVRMTPFFKSMKYSKTIPAKALRENPGLKEISYSITGGSLIGQGYWMPYQAAKAIAATFCWRIRWALTPVFGYDFPDTCLRPGDPRYGKFQICPKIVQACTEETNRFRELGTAYRITGPGGSVRNTPQLMNLDSPWEYAVPPPRKSEESGYYTGVDQNERFSASPQVSPRGSTWVSSWKSINGSVSPSSSPIIHSPPFDQLTHALPPLRQQLREHGVYFEARPTSVPTDYYSAPGLAKRTHSEVTIHRKGESDESWGLGSTPEVTSSRDGGGNELNAAEIMLQLSAADHALPAPKRTRRGSRY